MCYGTVLYAMPMLCRGASRIAVWENLHNRAELEREKEWHILNTLKRFCDANLHVGFLSQMGSRAVLIVHRLSRGEIFIFLLSGMFRDIPRYNFFSLSGSPQIAI